MPIKLHINIDHVATLREARGTRYPDPVAAAAACELAGADGITAHLREDRRHIQDRDIRLLRETVRTVLNLEMAAAEEIVALACELKPAIATLVPEKRKERTTEGGLDLKHGAAVGRALRALEDHGIAVSLFIDPNRPTVQAAADLGARRIELHTGDYCNAPPAEVQRELQRLATAAETGFGLGLHVAAGHGLDYPNVGPVAALEGVTELNIGHSIIARAVFTGLDRAVRDMRDAIDRASGR
ncbi:MAG TPA: pyridoxine 5'-phosphate synthase [Polyangia bacterium]